MKFINETLPSETFNVVIDSRFRDSNKYPNSSNYQIDLNYVFKNVVSITLTYAMYDRDQNTVLSIPYVNMYIDEVNANTIASSQYIARSFTQLPLTSTTNTFDSSMFKASRVFEKPMSKLAKLTVLFMDSHGNMYPMRDHMLRFEVKCMSTSAPKEWTNQEIISQDSVTIYKPQDPNSNTNTYANQTLAHTDNVNSVLKLPEGVPYDMKLLKTAFKSAKEVIQTTTDPGSEEYKKKYTQLKEGFKDILKNI
jgi:hypothetical protein